MRTAQPDERKSTGSHYTPNLLAGFVAEQIAQALEVQSRSDHLRVLDPGAGDGELLLCLAEVLTDQGFSNFEFFGFDTNPSAANFARSRLNERFPKLKTAIECKDFLSVVLQYYLPGENRTLFNPVPPSHYDVVIANPPYVRTQVMGAKKAQLLASQFGLTGRVDLYYAFLLGIARVLKPGGILGIIVSNRFMTTKSGSSVRENILKLYDVLHVYDMGDTKLFEAAVLPAVLLLRRKNGMKSVVPRFTSIYTTNAQQQAEPCTDAITALKKSGVVQTERGERFLVQQGRLEHGEGADEVWRIANGNNDDWLATVKQHTALTFSAIGKVRVGIKTTADKVFIRSDWGPKDQQPELLRPLTTHHICHRFKSDPPQSWVLYPHEAINGRKVAVDLRLYPKSKKYLEQHRSTLEKRKYVIQSGRNWFEVWVPQQPDLWKQPKLVWRDITEQPTFWIDLDGTIVNGDCYWLTPDSSHSEALLWLALSVGNSTFIEQFYDHRFHNKLYSGRRRFLTQYVEQFPLPNPDSDLANHIVTTAKQIYRLIPDPKHKQYQLELDMLVWEAFGLKKFAGK
ncbi:MAG: Eco57I restriction-modification methylase domain-containing protein [Syntrophobacteraceae bacterium]